MYKNPHTIVSMASALHLIENVDGHLKDSSELLYLLNFNEAKAITDLYINNKKTLNDQIIFRIRKNIIQSVVIYMDMIKTAVNRKDPDLMNDPSSYNILNRTFNHLGNILNADILEKISLEDIQKMLNQCVQSRSLTNMLDVKNIMEFNSTENRKNIIFHKTMKLFKHLFNLDEITLNTCINYAWCKKEVEKVDEQHIKKNIENLKKHIEIVEKDLKILKNTHKNTIKNCIDKIKNLKEEEEEEDKKFKFSEIKIKKCIDDLIKDEKTTKNKLKNLEDDLIEEVNGRNNARKIHAIQIEIDQEKAQLVIIDESGQNYFTQYNDLSSSNIRKLDKLSKSIKTLEDNLAVITDGFKDGEAELDNLMEKLNTAENELKEKIEKNKEEELKKITILNKTLMEKLCNVIIIESDYILDDSKRLKNKLDFNLNRVKDINSEIFKEKSKSSSEVVKNLINQNNMLNLENITIIETINNNLKNIKIKLQPVLNISDENDLILRSKNIIKVAEDCKIYCEDAFKKTKPIDEKSGAMDVLSNTFQLFFGTIIRGIVNLIVYVCEFIYKIFSMLIHILSRMFLFILSIFTPSTYR